MMEIFKGYLQQDRPHSATAKASAPKPAWAFVWLAIAALTLPFANGRLLVPAAAWIGPLFFVRFLRQQPRMRALILGCLVMIGLSLFCWNGILSIPGFGYFAVAAVLGVYSFLPYALDRVFAPKLTGLVSTLVLPLAFVTQEFFNSRWSPYGSWASLAYTQHGNLPLLQLLAITGLSGVTFLIAWFAALVNWAWEQAFEWKQIKRGIALYAAVLGVTLLFGGLRLVFVQPAETVRTATITPNIPTYTIKAVNENEILAQTLARANNGKQSLPEQWESFRHRSAEIQDELLARTEREAQSGAKIVVWSEGAAMLEKSDEAAMIARGCEIARQYQTVVAPAFLVLHADQTGRIENKMVLIDAGGNVASEYLKSHPVPGLEACVAGAGKIPVQETPYGRLAAAICFDLDFPDLALQAGKAGADILLCPSDDWREITPLHSQMAVFRAIEQGFSLIRSTGSGLSISVDYCGRIQAACDYFVTADRVMVSYVPIQGRSTFYGQFGEIFAWSCVIGFVVVLAMASPRVREKNCAMNST